MGQLTGQVAVITGAGTGVGRATALTLAQAGASVVLVGRTQAALQETADLVQRLPSFSPDAALIVPADMTDQAQVTALFDTVQARFGRIDILVNNAGSNIPDRALSVLTVANWRHLLNANLDSAFLCVHAVLPLMREQRSGTLIHIGSKASWRPSHLPGAAYTAAKAGLAGLSAVINAEERRHGIRSSVIMPGEVNTPILDKRPHPPTPEIREQVLQPEDVAACVLLIATLPARATVEELVLLPSITG